MPRLEHLKPSAPHAFNHSTDVPSLTRKVILITGANSGIGKQTAVELARHDPAQIWITAGPSVDVRLLQLDLTSFESIKAATKIVRAEAVKLDLLMLNAGIMGGPPGVTPGGYEREFGTNHVGHPLLFHLLTPFFIRTSEASAPKPRVVSVSSRGHAYEVPPGGIAFSTLKSVQLELKGTMRYTQSKLANVLYPLKTARHYPNLVSVVIYPEDVATQLLSKGAQGGGPEIEYLARGVAPRLGVSLDEDVKNGLWALIAQDAEWQIL
ncbi:hypothetical protein E8E11_000353 [Didymella keratinophila]|nr:hypothetical protein E8E11_000353 [Didymella keratinophila]